MAIAAPLLPSTVDIAIEEARRLHIEGPVGRGSVATVYRAYFETPMEIQRAVAVKVFDRIASDERDTVIAALASASRRMAAVRHPNVVRVEDFGLAGPAQPYILEELVEGVPLSALFAYLSQRRERMPLDLALFIGIEVADALAGARLAASADGIRLGIVHGELAPSDVLLSWHGEVKVCDFGVGGAARAASSVRRNWTHTRRLDALAPEVVRGQSGDARSDVFSLGVLLHEMFVGPRFGRSPAEDDMVAWAHEGAVRREIFEPQPDVSLHPILDRALEPDPVERYAHAGALGYDLRHAALAMGVADGRAFLRSLLARAFAGDEANAELETRPAPVPETLEDAELLSVTEGDESS
jgi:serine/threonine-protein kinase